jgi:hypothetical protein
VSETSEKVFWIAAGIGGCANCLEIGDEIEPIVRRLRKLQNELLDLNHTNRIALQARPGRI